MSPPSPTIPSVAPPAIIAPVGGPQGALFELHPSIRLTEDYSDNFRQSGRGKVDNLRSSLSPGFTLSLNAPRTKGLIAYTLSEAYDSSREEFRTFHSLFGQLTWQATPRLTLVALDTFTRSDEPSQADRLSLRRGRGTFSSNVFSVAANYTIATVSTREYYRLSTFEDDLAGDTVTHAVGATASTRVGETNTLTLGYEYLTSRTSGGRGITSNDLLSASGISRGPAVSIPQAGTTGHTFTASVARQLTSALTGGVSGSYSFRTPTSTSSRGGSDFQIWDVSVFSAYALPGRFSLSTNIGVSRLTSDSGVDKTAITTLSALVYHFAQGVATVGFERGFSETFALGENFGVVETQGVTATLAYPITPLMTANATAFYRENMSTGVSAGQSSFDQNSWGGSLGVSFQLRTWLTLDLAYFLTHRESATRQSDSFTENRLRASLIASF